MSRFAILLGGAVTRTPELEAEIAGARVIAADSGMRHAAALGVTPELWLGDFDSVTEDLLETYRDIPRQVFPREKDKTDGEIAIHAAIERGATSLVLVGAFGGPRHDQVMLHFSQAIRYAEQGLGVVLTSGREVGRPLRCGEVHSFDYPDGTLFSVLPFSGLSGLTIEGARWPLRSVEVPFGSSLTISNEVQGELKISVKQGRALLLVTLDPANHEV
ncbi:thiamine diphosphokinase [Chelativorans composti]|jgi:thiamine pyrophosphokinase|uniref:Thiamine diphosphokinase n=1 Tax=Chelativorans composti TaxID=768533 RepID=A0ABW5DET5_9HYPH